MESFDGIFAQRLCLFRDGLNIRLLSMQYRHKANNACLESNSMAVETLAARLFRSSKQHFYVSLNHSRLHPVDCEKQRQTLLAWKNECNATYLDMSWQMINENEVAGNDTADESEDEAEAIHAIVQCSCEQEDGEAVQNGDKAIYQRCD